jgi:hypothetical protein
MTRLALALVAGCLTVGLAAAADPPKVDRTIKKEPTYQTKAPKYGLLVFGPEAADRVWLVWDGEALYVDRNGNADLTEPGEKVAAEKPRHGRPRGEEDDYSFDVGELTVGGRTHKGFTVLASPLAALGGPSFQAIPSVKAARAKDPKAVAFWLGVEVEQPGMKGGGFGGRLRYRVGPLDANGPLVFADRPADAPVVHFGGRLEVTFDAEPPALRVGRESGFTLVVGTRGEGPGTFAALGYEGTIPKGACPVAEVTYPPAKPGDPPVKEKYEIKERC